MDTFGNDLRHAVRRLVRTPGFTATAMLTLGLGMAATTTMFSVINGVLLRPLPYPEPDRIVRLFEVQSNGNRNRVTDPNFADLHERNGSFEALAQFGAGVSSVAGGSEPVRAVTAAVSRDFFDVFGMHPVIGRSFVAEEHQLGAAPAVIVAQGFWQQYLGASEDVIGTTLRIDGDPAVVVGVMPPGFDYPGGASLWVPRELFGVAGRTAHNYNAAGRLAAGVSIERAREELSSIARQLLQVHGQDTNMADAAVVPLHEQTVASARPVVLLLFGAAALLLLIACLNVVNLLLARLTVRQRELAVRLALGAGRIRLARVFLSESLLFAVAGGVLGVLLAGWGTAVLRGLEIGNLPRAAEIRLDSTVLAFSVGVSVLAAALLGLIAAWRAAGPDIRGALAGGTQGAARGGAGEGARRALVVSQVGLTMVLLIGAGLLARSLLLVLDVDPGFRTRGAVVMDVALPSAPDDAQRQRRADLIQELIERLATIPGVQEVGAAGVLPLGGSYYGGTFLVLNYPDEVSSFEAWSSAGFEADRRGSAHFRTASEAYFRAMGIPLLRGRLFGPTDGPDAPHVALISESLANTRWPNEDPIGKLIQFGNMDGDFRAFTIVGIVGDIHEASLEAEPQPTFYAYYRQRPTNTTNFSLVMQGPANAASVVPVARRILAELNPDVPPNFRTLEQIYASSLAERRFHLLLVALFSVTALTLALMGIYGVMSFAVTQRTREIGVRVALGAPRGNVLGMVAGQALVLAGVGIAIGLAGALGVTRLLAGFLYGVTTTDPLTFVVVPLLLLAAALCAAYAPARRATRVDPVIALRAE